jgi:D-ala D-ala ligase C-terminus/RimK-like ATP-grasp domain
MGKVRLRGSGTQWAILDRVCARHGAVIRRDETLGGFIPIELRSGGVTYMQKTGFGLNTVTATLLATDKVATYEGLRKAGVSVPRTESIRRGSPYDPEKLAAQFMPAVVKPNGGTQGNGVSFVWTADELADAVDHAWEWDEHALVQETVCGDEIRAVVYEDDLVIAYQKLPPIVRGDGVRPVQDLIDDGPASVGPSDVVTRPGRLDRVPEAGELVRVRWAANLLSPLFMRDLSEHLPVEIAELAIRIARTMNLRYCGIDLVTHEFAADRLCVLETNGEPDLNRYAAHGPAQEQRTERLLERIFLELEQAWQTC